jgi:(p)ppGpp synthase/HD superfamily hydrolase
VSPRRPDTLFPLGPISQERAVRLRDRSGNSEAARRAFARALRQAPSSVDRDRVTRAYGFSRNLRYNHPGLTQGAYLAHPLRVARLVLELDPRPTTSSIVVALLHNVLEVSDISVHDLTTLVGRRVSDVIRLLKVDRTDGSAAAVEAYYDRLDAGPRSGRVVKVLDKLDNLFTLCLNPEASVRTAYLAEVRRRILPMTVREMPRLVAYLTALIEDCHTTGYLERATPS